MWQSMPHARNTPTIMCTMQRQSKLFWQSWQELTGCRSSRMHPHQVGGWCILLPTLFQTSTRWWRVTWIWQTSSWHTVLAQRAADAIARNPSIPSCMEDMRKRRRTRTINQKRTLAPTTRNSTAGSPTTLTQTSACGTKSKRVTPSSWCAIRLKWHSNHATVFWQS